jgi:hypothetical protein
MLGMAMGAEVPCTEEMWQRQTCKPFQNLRNQCRVAHGVAAGVAYSSAAALHSTWVNGSLHQRLPFCQGTCSCHDQRAAQDVQLQSKTYTEWKRRCGLDNIGMWVCL